MDPVLRARALVKAFGSTRAVDGVDVTVGRGQRVALLGPNGAGKTTTLMMLLGAITPDGGSVEIGGHLLPGARHEAMGQLGFAAGYLPLPERLRVDEALVFFARLYGVADPHPVVAASLERLGITRLGRQRCSELSSGQRTLVGIAKAVLHEPPLVVLDEPTASLDPEVAGRVRRGLLALAEGGTALLLTSHNMDEVEELSDHVIFLRRGRIAAEGPPDELLRRLGLDSLEDVFLELASDDESPPATDVTRPGEPDRTAGPAVSP